MTNEDRRGSPRASRRLDCRLVLEHASPRSPPVISREQRSVIAALPHPRSVEDVLPVLRQRHTSDASLRTSRRSCAERDRRAREDDRAMYRASADAHRTPPVPFRVFLETFAALSRSAERGERRKECAGSGGVRSEPPHPRQREKAAHHAASSPSCRPAVTRRHSAYPPPTTISTPIATPKMVPA